jgi:hypothetical protein
LLPQSAPDSTSIAHDLNFEWLGARLHHLDIDARNNIVISYTAPEDSLFAARQIRRAAPQSRIIFLNLDSLYLHPDYAADVDGALATTNYPNLVWQNRDKLKDESSQLSRDSAVGMYLAAKQLLDPAGAYGKPCTTIGVLRRGRFWQLIEGRPSELDNYRCDPSASISPTPSSDAKWLWFGAHATIAGLLAMAMFVRRAPRDPSRRWSCFASMTSIAVLALVPLVLELREAAWLILAVYFAALGIAALLDKCLERVRAFSSGVVGLNRSPVQSVVSLFAGLGVVALTASSIAAALYREGTERQLLAYRAVELTSGVSPLVPIGLACLACFAASFVGSHVDDSRSNAPKWTVAYLVGCLIGALVVPMWLLRATVPFASYQHAIELFVGDRHTVTLEKGWLSCAVLLAVFMNYLFAYFAACRLFLHGYVYRRQVLMLLHAATVRRLLGLPLPTDGRSELDILASEREIRYQFPQVFIACVCFGLSVSEYPLHPARLAATGAATLLLVASAVCVATYVTIERHSVSSTKFFEGSAPLEGRDILTVLAWGAVPLWLALSAYFPELQYVVTQWIKSHLSLLPPK